MTGHRLQGFFANKEDTDALEFLTIEKLKDVVERLKLLVRVTGPGMHKTLVQGGVREDDFEFSEDRQHVKPNKEKGLSFATSAKKLKSLISLHKKFYQEILFYSISETAKLPEGLQFIRDRPGHASLVVITEMKIVTLISKLEDVACQLEPIGKIKVEPWLK